MQFHQTVLYKWNDDHDYESVTAISTDKSLNIISSGVIKGWDKHPGKFENKLSIPLIETQELCFLLRSDPFNLHEALAKKFNSTNAFEDLALFLDVNRIGYVRYENDSLINDTTVGKSNGQETLEVTLYSSDTGENDQGIYKVDLIARFQGSELIIENFTEAKYWDTGILTNCTRLIVSGEATWELADLERVSQRSELLASIFRRFSNKSMKDVIDFLKSNNIAFLLEEQA